MVRDIKRNVAECVYSKAIHRQEAGKKSYCGIASEVDFCPYTHPSEIIGLFPVCMYKKGDSLSIFKKNSSDPSRSF